MCTQPYLHNLLAYVSNADIVGPTNKPISSLVYDSRQVQPESLFVAIKGYHTDGHRYIPKALEQGATAIVVDTRYFNGPMQESITYIGVPNSRAALAPLAAAFYNYPAQQLGVVGITGTKGKTTTTTLVASILDHSGYRTGMISTVDFKVGPHQWTNALRQSTPEAPEIQALLRQMVDAHCDYAVLESSSHALSPSWNRLGHCAFDVAVHTNVTHEHLDYHGTIEQYRQDKTQLFAKLGETFIVETDTTLSTTPAPEKNRVKSTKIAIVNADDPHHAQFLNAAPATAQKLTYAIDAPADIRAYAIHTAPHGSSMHLATPWGNATLTLQLPGIFNIRNALAALSVALSQGIPLEQATTALHHIQSIPGRMERIEHGQPFNVVIDYAHNPDSFTQVMSMLRPLTTGRIIAVFGSAGERDQQKRSIQGNIAAHYCELLILTDEDPRGEDPEAIIADIASGARQAGKIPGKDYFSIPNRAKAIRTAFEHAQAGDLVLLLGKGHEGSIEYADGKHAWNESDEARAALQEMGYEPR